MSSIRITCPKAEWNTERRKEELLKQVEEWTRSAHLKSLLTAFGAEIPNTSFTEYLTWLNQFVDCWDFRKKQAMGGERWSVNDTSEVLKNSELIITASKVLGFVDRHSPIMKPDFILPLGGARLTNLERCQYAKVLLDQYGSSNTVVAALASMRPINEIEMPYLLEYAPKATTEYAAICKGLEKSFSLQKKMYFEEKGNSQNPNLNWLIREYHQGYNGHKIYSIAAPSSQPERRANSLDTFEFFLKKFSVPEKSSILLCTNSIYVNYQLLKFIPLAFEYGLNVDCVGTPIKSKNDFNKLSNYCQEIKGTINAIFAIYQRYTQQLRI